MSHPRTIGEAVEKAADIIELARSAGDLDDPEAMEELVCKHLGWDVNKARPSARLVIALHDVYMIAPEHRPGAK